jgi:hypothetical protein
MQLGVKTVHFSWECLGNRVPGIHLHVPNLLGI